MPDILFKCPNCSQGLAIDSDAAGSKIECTECGWKIVVPVPNVTWECPACSAALASSSSLVGEFLDCPTCGASGTVPGGAMETKPSLRLAHKCPSCDVPMEADAVICLSCGYDRRTGKKAQASLPSPTAMFRPPRIAEPERERRPVFALGMVALVLVVAGIVGYQTWRKRVDANSAKVPPVVIDHVGELRVVKDALHSVVIPEFQFLHADLWDIVEFLNQTHRKQTEPNGKGVAFVLGTTPSPAIKVTISGRGMRFDQVLDLVAEATGYSYEASNNVVTLRPGGKVPDTSVSGNKEDSKAMRGHLSDVLVPEVDFRQATIYDILEFLDRGCREGGVPSGGVNFVFLPRQTEMGGGEVPVPKITMAARQVPLDSVLDVIAKVTGCPWVCEGNIVIIRSSSKENPGDQGIEDCNAQFSFGNIDFFGWAGLSNYEGAAKWYRKAADQGHVAAQFSLGFCFFTGKGVELDEAQAVSWWKRAAEGSNVNARTCLGFCFLEGLGVPKDRVKAMELLVPNAEAGDDVAQYLVGRYYYQGSDETNIVAALYWLEQAAGKGNAASSNLLSVATRKLVQNAIDLFGTRKNDPQFTNDVDLLPVANAIAQMKARTVFPTARECESLLKACQHIVEKDVAPALLRAVIGSQLIIEHENEMLDAGLQRYGGVFMDAESIAKAKQSSQERTRMIEQWQNENNPEMTTQYVMKRVTRRVPAPMQGRRSAHSNPSFQQWVTKTEMVRVPVPVRKSQYSSETRTSGNGDGYGAYLIGQMGGQVMGSSGSTTWGTAPKGSSPYDNYMWNTLGGRIGVTANAGEFGGIINPGGINY